MEMEWLPIAQACELSRMGGLCIGEVRYHLSGAPSDWPLEGKTLADTLYDRKGEVAIVRAYKERIMRG